MTEIHFLFDKVSNLSKSGRNRQAVELLVSMGWSKSLAEQQVQAVKDLLDMLARCSPVPAGEVR